MFDRCLKFVLQYEGGFSDDPKDPGNWTGGHPGKGILKGTKYGIAANTFPNLDIRNLTIQQAGDIYKRRYWTPNGCDDLPPALALVVFDSAVNSGSGRAQEWLKRSGGDVSAFVGLRLEFLTGLDIWPEYSRGWSRRLAALLQEAGKMEAEDRPVELYDPATNKRVGSGTLIGGRKVYVKK